MDIFLPPGGYEGDKENDEAEEGEGAVEADWTMWAEGGYGQG